jgi:hypothetical protein
MLRRPGILAAVALVVSAVAWAPAANAGDGVNTLWYVESLGDGYDVEVEYSATSTFIHRETTPDGPWRLSHGYNRTNNGNPDCSFGDENSPNYRRQTIPQKTNENGLNPSTHTYCVFNADAGLHLIGGNSGGVVASATLTAVTNDGSRYVIPSGTPGNVFNYVVRPRNGTARQDTRSYWVTERLPDTGQCVPETGQCGKHTPTWTSTSAPASFVDATLKYVDDHFDLLWQIRWAAPVEMMEEATSALGSVRPEDCTITGTPGDDVLVGTDGDDVICGLGGNDTIDGRGGDDILKGGAGDDVLNGGPGDDILGGGPGDDVLNGGSGDDLGHGGTGQDLLDGGTGTDHMAGNSGDDIMASQPGDPVIVVDEDGHNVHDSTDVTVIEDSNGDGTSAGQDVDVVAEMM